jgi:hypothetical protein
MSAPDTDRNLLFGILALQAEILHATRFAEACIAWSARKATPFGELLLERGWISAAERNAIEQLLAVRLQRLELNDNLLVDYSFFTRSL